ncbi:MULTISPECIES: hypothetical protein [unclassified Sedimentibacter]|uniref:hypothetical protein n=1 Tax=unclassified Sedimentibacter TaxID=2649220 RepID=UPI0027E0BA00|nr:hypothetical protein [Sedimentibacter sp. MB35-C1]WMJ78443.1 hypothetical protein RBQ61_05755 [Sedimentibacter sp. MB35-C1]
MYKGIKKTASLLVIMIGILALLGPVAQAYQKSEQNISQELLIMIEETNNYIYKEIDKAVEKAEKEVLKDQSEQQLNRSIDRIIENLLRKTSRKVDLLIKKAAREGVVLTKTYVEVQIYDRVVLVDPCYAH